MKTILLIAVAASALATAGCGGDETTAADTTPATTVETVPAETETAATPPPPATPKPKPSAPKVTTVAIRVVGGVPRGGIARPKVKKGTRVVVVVRADAGEAVHIHGYDLEKPVTPGTPVRLPFRATIPGRFEIELHHPDALLGVLTVTP